jgi:subtilisin family serine protease
MSFSGFRRSTDFQSRANEPSGDLRLRKNSLFVIHFFRSISMSDNTFSTARYSGSFGSSANVVMARDKIGGRERGSRDNFDFLRFKLNGCSNVALSLSKLASNADLTLLNNSGNTLGSSTRVTSRTRSLNTQLNAGDYVIRVTRKDKQTRYQLSLTTSPCATPAQPAPAQPAPAQPALAQPAKSFNAVYGYGLVNAAAAVARSLGQSTPFADVDTKNYFSPDPKLDQWTWGLDAVKAPEAWAKGYTGQGVVVAVIDSGITIDNPRLSRNVWRNNNEIPGNNIDDDRNGYVDDVEGWDFMNGDNTPIDIEGHGTFVAGIIADTASGIAKNAKVMSVKISGRVDDYENDVTQGIYYAVQNGAKVINISYGVPSATVTPQLQQALQFARQSNVLVVTSAGNSRKEGAFQPDNIAAFTASRNYGITVGAIDRSGKFADFSNPAGNSPLDYVVAPGVEVYSDSFNYYTFEPTYESGSGTSFSAPAVAGIAALMLSANPSLTPDQIEKILIDTASRSVFI